MRTVFLISMALVFITLAVYMQTGNHEFVNYDDPSYVTQNPHVASGITCANIMWAVTSIDNYNWHPLTWLSHMADVQLFGLNPRGHHLTSVVIHTVSSLLLLLLLHRVSGSLWRSAFVAALFALHPLHVESVAWVAERKDVLSAFFCFLTLLLYADYVVKRKPILYVAVLVFFVLGLMSKPMLVTLPIVMLLIDFWPLGRYRRDDQEQGLRQLIRKNALILKEKIPFFACSLFSGIVTIYAQHTGGATQTFDELPFMLRTENALVAYVKYIIKTLWPSDLAVLYPIPPSFPPWQIVGSLLVLLFISAAAIYFGRRYPYFPVGWFWFLITLLPVIGLLQVGVQAMADRYSYLPVIGLFIMAAWGIPDLLRGLQQRERILALLAGIVIAISAVLTWHQLGYWRDSISLYRHALHVTTGNGVIHNNLGDALSNKGDKDGAIEEFRESLRINPNNAEAHNNLGSILLLKGNSDVAIIEFREALRILPNHAAAHNNLGLALDKNGNLDAAIPEYQEALRINPIYAHAHINLGFALDSKGFTDAAIREYQEALRINPNHLDTRNNLGAAFARKGNLDAAIQQYQAALVIDPNNSTVHGNLGFALARMGNLDAAIREYQAALRIDPNNARAFNNLGLAFERKNKLEEVKK